MASPCAGDLEDQRLQDAGVLDDVEHREIADDERAHQGDEREGEQNDLGDRCRLGAFHPAQMAGAGTGDWQNALHKSNGERQAQCKLANFWDHGNDTSATDRRSVRGSHVGMSRTGCGFIGYHSIVNPRRFDPSTSEGGTDRLSAGLSRLVGQGLDHFVNNTPPVSSVPAVKPRKVVQSGGGVMKHAMWICCAVMLAPLGLYFVQGGTVAGLSSTLGLFAPLVLCVGMHFVLHRVMGRSCHGSGGETAPKLEEARVEERERHVSAHR